MLILQTHGYLYLLKEAPQFAKLVDHMYTTLPFSNTTNLEYQWPRKTRKLFPQWSKRSINQTLGLCWGKILIDYHAFQPTSMALETQPARNKLDCHPSMIKRLAMVLMPYTLHHHIVYKNSGWLKLLSQKLKRLDESLSGGKTTKFDDEHVYQRSITRVPILWCIADTCNTNGIFASSGMDQFLQSPAVISEQPLSCEWKFAPEVLKQHNIVLEPAPLFTWIGNHLAEHSNITTDAKWLSELADLQILKLFLGRRSTSDDDNPAVENLKSGRSTTKATKEVALVSDVLTKVLTKSKVQHFIEMLGLREIKEKSCANHSSWCAVVNQSMPAGEVNDVQWQTITCRRGSGSVKYMSYLLLYAVYSPLSFLIIYLIRFILT